MKLFSSLAFLGGVASTVSAYATFQHIDSNVIPNRFIVELSDASAFTKRGDAQHLDPHARFHSHMRRAELEYSVVSSFNSTYLVGASLEVSDADIKQVSSMDSVKAVYPVRRVPRPRPHKDRVDCVSGSPAEPADTFSTHQMTGVDRLHAAGIYGAGVQIAVIDTGIDYMHPALGGCFGPGCKVVKGYDFVGDAYNGSNTPIPDDDPMDCNGHGSHVAGIMGADPNPLNFTGVAPQATLAAYRIFGCDGSAANDVIIPAMIQAADDGADVISMSIGGPAGWTEDILSVLAQRLVESGIVVSISQGNDGDEGLFYTSSPATGLGVISVSSVDNIVTPSMVAFLSTDSTNPIATYSSTFDPAHDVDFSLYIPADIQACSAIEDDLTGLVVIAQRGTCTFVEKAENVLQAGGSILLVYNNVAGALTPSFGDSEIIGALISLEDGERIVAAFSADPSVTITFPSTYYSLPNTETGGLVSDFTSYGPTFDMQFKPSVAAPGAHILSTWPLALGAYAVISGTSMACPFISGVAALMISANGKMDPVLLRSIIETTAVPIPSTVNGSVYNTVAQQGAGLVDAFAAVYTKTLVSPGEVPLNDTLHLVSSFNISITNNGKASNSYRLSNLPAQTALTFSDEGAQVNLEPPLVDGAAELSFSKDWIEVECGSSVQIEVYVDLPQWLNASNVPVVSGFVKVESEDGSEVYTVPYLGTAASLYHDFPILDTTDDIFGFDLPTLIDYAGNPIDSANSSSSIPSFTFIGTDAPELVYRLIGGSALIYLDLLPADTLFSPTIGSSSTNGSSLARRMSRRVKKDGVPNVGSVGQLAASTYNYRNAHADPTAGNGTVYFDVRLSARTGDGLYFSSGEIVPNAAYKLLFRALKFFGNPTEEDDYESWLSPAFAVNQS